jgi:hypothetical protein
VTYWVFARFVPAREAAQPETAAQPV